MNRRSASKAQRPLAAALVLFSLVAVACDRAGRVEDPSALRAEADLLQRLLDHPGPPEQRALEVLALGVPQQVEHIPVLLRLLKNRSQCAFLLEPDPAHSLGLRPVEFIEKEGPEVDPARRIAAVVALERIGTHRALIDLLMALEDGDHKVRAHAARALIVLGSRAGIPVLLKLLDERAYGNETADQMLQDITGQDMGFHQDAGFAARDAARQRWVAWFADPARDKERWPLEGLALQIGRDPEADRRILYHVDMLGQFQFLYHQQARLALRRLGALALPYLEQGIDRARSEDRPTLRAGIAEVLAEIPHDQSLRLLEQLVRDPHPTVRSRAAISLAAIGTDAALHALEPALKDTDASVPIETLQALGRVRREPAIALIQSVDAKGDAALSLARTAALFEASGGRLEREEVLALLASDRVEARNAAHRVLLAVTGTDLSFQPMGTKEHWLEVQAAYRSRLAP